MSSEPLTRPESSAPGHALAVDIGGTFTDLIAYDAEGRQIIEAKSLTTPRDLVQGILDCLAKSGVPLGETGEIVHGSTVAINTVLESKGARTGLIVTRGTRDVYAIGRANRPAAYDVFFKRPVPLVPRSATFEVRERMRADGEVDVALDEKDVRAACAALAAAGVDAVAVCLLHSYANPAHERRVGELVREALPDVYLSLSHEILREYREYERSSTTVINSYVGPVVGRYIEGLGERLSDQGFAGRLWIMQSNGGVMTPATAARKPVAMLESGPVGGIVAAAEVGRRLGFDDVIAFDMGGTTAKASLIREGTPAVADGYYVGGYAEGQPVLIPVVDVVEVGTGGGSVAWIDEVGALKVGPRSAGAEPGPIAYARGGTEPTITDANVALGRIRPEAFMGGEMALDAEAARAGIEASLARPLGLDVWAAARGILEIAIAKMSLAVREVSVAKGYDPRDFVLLASGGAGPLHAVAIARELHIPKVIVPRFPGHFSALGMLLSDQTHDFVRTFFAKLDAADPARLREIRDELAGEAGALANGAGGELQLQTTFDLRYAGQDFALPVPVGDEELAAGDLQTVRRRFDELHERRYGHSASGERVELVNVRLRATAARAKPVMGAGTGGAVAEALGHTEVHWDASGTAAETPIHLREALAVGTTFSGPAIVEEDASTTVVFPGDHVEVAATGDLIVTVGSGA